MLTPAAYSPHGVPLILAVTPPNGVPTTFATVLSANLHGYDQLAEALPPGELVSLLEVYFTVVTDAVLEFGGQILHLAEADMMAGFGLGDCRHTQIVEAIAAARAIQQRVAPLLRSWRQRWSIGTGVGLGIHRGEFALASFGPPAEPSLLIVGDTANLVSALSHRARAGEILISNAVHGPHDQATAPRPPAGEPIRGLADVKLQGRSTALDLWCIAAPERLKIGRVPASPGRSAED